MNYEIITKLNFGTEIQDVLKYYGVTNTELFLHPRDSSVESPYLFDNIELGTTIFKQLIDNNVVVSLVVD